MNPKSICIKISSLFFLLSTSLFATHNKAGEIRYQRIAPFTQVVGTATVPVYNYSITVIKYLNTGSNIADRCVDTVYFGDGAKGIAPRINGASTCGCGNLGTVTIGCGTPIANSAGPTILCYYSITHTYAGPGSYTIKSADPNRNAGINNIPNSVNQLFYIDALLVIGSTSNNNSAVLLNPPTEPAYVNNCYYHHPIAYDADGDSLTYELVPCSGGNGSIPGYTFPSAGSGTFMIDQTTGLVSWCNPQLQGLFSFAIRIKEWRLVNCTPVLVGSVLRDMEVKVQANTGAQTVSITGATSVCVVAGKPFNSSVAATLSPLVGTLTANVYGDPAHSMSSAANNFVTYVQGTTSVIYTWLTSCNESRPAYYPVVFKYEIAGAINVVTYHTLKVKVLPPSPIIRSIQKDSNWVKLNWKPLNTCVTNLSHYRIYRKVGSNFWVHSPCENGAPPGSGFVFIGQAPGNDSTFTDYNLWSFPNGSTGNYVVTAKTSDCLESYADSARSTILIVGIKENKLEDRHVSIYPIPFSSQLIIQAEKTVQGYSLKIFDAAGKLIMQRSNEGSWNEIDLDTSPLPKGLYMLRLETDEGGLTKRIIKE